MYAYETTGSNFPVVICIIWDCLGGGMHMSLIDVVNLTFAYEATTKMYLKMYPFNWIRTGNLALPGETGGGRRRF